MHPLGWLVRYFLVALVGAVTADKALSMIAEVGEPYRGLIFRWGRRDAGNDRPRS